MKALLSYALGGPKSLVLAETEDPVPGPGEVVIRVHACGINFPDTLIIEDRYQFKPPRPFAPGGEVSGTVEAVGPGVISVAIGDRVIGCTLWGGLAEKILVPEHRCVPIPDDMPFDHAAAFLLTFGTSYYALKTRGQLKDGDTVVVLGAAGGIGLASVALSKAMGARVIAAVSSSEKAAIARARGADDVVLYPADIQSAEVRRKLTSELKAATGERGADVIVDAVGGQYSEAALRAIAWNGRFLVVGFPSGIPNIALNLALLKSCQIIGVFWGAWIDREPDEFRKSTRELMCLYEGSLVFPVISERFSLESAASALELLQNRKAVGKIVVTVRS